MKGGGMHGVRGDITVVITVTAALRVRRGNGNAVAGDSAAGVRRVNAIPPDPARIPQRTDLNASMRGTVIRRQRHAAVQTVMQQGAAVEWRGATAAVIALPLSYSFPYATMRITCNAATTGM